MEIRIIDYGRIDYFEALDIQRKLQQERIEESIPDTLMVVEHEPVLTLGKRGEYSNILVSEKLLKEKGIQTVEVEAGRGHNVPRAGAAGRVSYTRPYAARKGPAQIH